MSQPAAVSSAICCSVAFTSAVSVVVIDCTETGKSLPTPTLPTISCLVLRRSASTGGGVAGMPSMTPSLMPPGYRPSGPARWRVRSLTCLSAYWPIRIGLTMSAVTVSNTTAPPMKITTIVTADSLV